MCSSVLAIVLVDLYVCLTLPPVVSASPPTSAKRQSVPSKVITDIMTLGEEKKEYIVYCIFYFFSFNFWFNDINLHSNMQHALQAGQGDIVKTKPKTKLNALYHGIYARSNTSCSSYSCVCVFVCPHPLPTACRASCL